MELTLNKWGNSQGIRLPAKLIRQLGWQEMDSLTAEAQDNTLVIKPTTNHDDGSLEWLCRGYVDDGIREPLVDFGESAGKEQWQYHNKATLFGQS